MKTILLFGAGKSATCLIEYLGKCCDENNWKFWVCDSDSVLAQSKTKGFSSAEVISFDVSDEKRRQEYIPKADIVISLLPPRLHSLVAQDCVTYSRNLLTASYMDEKIKSLSEQIRSKGLLFIGEMGLDPGIDHMSAMKIIDGIHQAGGEITSFKSHCGGLISPESDDNPWHYKITWNPANVVLAGNAGARFRKEGETIEIPYERIFSNENRQVDIPGLFPLAWYANRDSLSYIDTYGLHTINSFIRTTLRYPSFCRGWEKMIRLGLTRSDDEAEISSCKTFSDWFELKKKKLFPQDNINPDEETFFDPEFSEQLRYLGLNEPLPFPEEHLSSATLLQYLLEKKLVMKAHDKDLIIMLHEIEFRVKGKRKEVRSCLLVKGEDSVHTAMAKTVGLPLGIAAKLILEGKIEARGLHIPSIPEIYEPVLKELQLNGIHFDETVKDLNEVIDEKK